jgi:hypothetical protein
MEKNRATETILTITLGFLAIYLGLYIFKGTSHLWMLYVSFSVAFLGLFWKWLGIQIHEFWFWLAEKIGYVMSRLLLSIIYIVFLIPIGVIAGLFRKDLMLLKRGRSSYFKKRTHTYSASDLENPW